MAGEVRVTTPYVDIRYCITGHIVWACMSWGWGNSTRRQAAPVPPPQSHVPASCGADVILRGPPPVPQPPLLQPPLLQPPLL